MRRDGVMGWDVMLTDSQQTRAREVLELGRHTLERGGGWRAVSIGLVETGSEEVHGVMRSLPEEVKQTDAMDIKHP